MTKRIPMVLSEVAYNALKIKNKLIYVEDIKLTLKTHNKTTIGKKAELIRRLDAVFSDNSEYRGPSFDRVVNITNTEDFYTFQSIDEISPDTCTLWDIKTNEKLCYEVAQDDIDKIIPAYKEVKTRLGV